MEKKVKELLSKTREGALNLKGELERVFKVRDSKDRKIFYSVLGVILFVLFYLIFVRGYFVKQGEKKMAEEKIKVEQLRQERVEKIEAAPKSRISFFLAAPVRANLAIPDYWEGNYRMTESDKKAVFTYIENAANTAQIFYIKMVTLEDLENLEAGEKEIDSNKRVKKGDVTYAFVYRIAADNPYAQDEKLRGQLDRMKIDANEMIKKYFKTF